MARCEETWRISSGWERRALNIPGKGGRGGGRDGRGRDGGGREGGKTCGAKPIAGPRSWGTWFETWRRRGRFVGERGSFEALPRRRLATIESDGLSSWVGNCLACVRTWCSLSTSMGSSCCDPTASNAEAVFKDDFRCGHAACMRVGTLDSSE